jgi:hypothetical protein
MAKMDPKLVAKTEQYEVAYFARKHRISAADARDIIQRARRSREKANELAEAEKKKWAGRPYLGSAVTRT